MSRAEINTGASDSLRRRAVPDVKQLSVTGRAARMLLTAFSAMVLTTASAHATKSGGDNKQIAMGSVDSGESGSSDSEALGDRVFSVQDSLARGAKSEQSRRANISAASVTLSDVLGEAETMIGTPYLWGGNSPETGLDCSGFVRYVYEKAAGILLPRLSVEISRKGLAIAQRDLHPGDLVFFNTSRGEATHVGIYVGGYRFIHAPKKGSVIRVESMKSAYWTARYYGARRVVT
jgi:cell wall-associated NlpC family hydrolase